MADVFNEPVCETESDSFWIQKLEDRLLHFTGDSEHGFFCTFARQAEGWLAVIHRATDESFAAVAAERDEAFLLALSQLFRYRGGAYRRALAAPPGSGARV